MKLGKVTGFYVDFNTSRSPFKDTSGPFSVCGRNVARMVPNQGVSSLPGGSTLPTAPHHKPPPNWKELLNPTRQNYTLPIEKLLSLSHRIISDLDFTTLSTGWIHHAHWIHTVYSCHLSTVLCDILKTPAVIKGHFLMHCSPQHAIKRMSFFFFFF